MAKVTNMAGIAKGKVGAVVYAVRNGQQIARQYQPYVSNPSTPSQVESRSKLKMLSQISANMAPVIAIPREGAVTPRNRFTRANYRFAQYAGMQASMKYADMQLTDSAVALEGFNVDRSDGEKIGIALLADMSLSFDRIVYVMCVKTTAGAFVPYASVVVNDPGIDGCFAGELPYTEGDVSIHAYGIKDKTAAAKAAFGNLGAGGAVGVATLLANRSVKTEDVSLSETRGLVLAEGQSTGETTGVVTYLVVVAKVDTEGQPASAAGTISGAGRYQEGQTATLQATAAAGYRFVKWQNADTHTQIGSQATIQLIMNSDRSIEAVFEEIGNKAQLTLAFTSDSLNTSAALQGGGQKTIGSQVTVTAPAGDADNSFDGWFADAAATQLLHAQREYTFTMPDTDKTLYAKYSGLDEG